MYEYRAQILRIVDGDTVHARVDLGFDIRFDMKLRLTGINAPELHDKPAGQLATGHLADLLGFFEAAAAEDAGQVTIRTEKDRTEKYGRYLATLIYRGININARMIEDGHAVAYAP